MNAEILQIIKYNCKPENDNVCWYQNGRITFSGDITPSFSLSQTKVFKAIFPHVKIGMGVKPALFVRSTCKDKRCLNPAHFYLKSKEEIENDNNKEYVESLAEEKRIWDENFAKNIFECAYCKKFFQGSKPHELTGTREHFCNKNCRFDAITESEEIKDRWATEKPHRFEEKWETEKYRQKEGKDYTARKIAVNLLLGCDGGTYDPEKYFCPKKKLCIEPNHLMVKDPLTYLLENNIAQIDKRYFYAISKGELWKQLAKSFIDGSPEHKVYHILNVIKAINAYYEIEG